MTLRESVQALKKQGYKIKFRNRSDGSIVVTSVNGKSYKGKEGNALVRSLTGQTLSERRVRQLHSKPLLTKKGQWGHKLTRKLTDREWKRRVRRVQREFRKNDVKKGTPRMRNIRYTLEHYGQEEALRRLKQAERYAKGIAYPENIEALAKRIRLDANKLDEGKVKKDAMSLADWLEAHAYSDTITEDQLEQLIDALYDSEQGKKDFASFISTANLILKR